MVLRGFERFLTVCACIFMYFHGFGCQDVGRLKRCCDIFGFPFEGFRASECGFDRFLTDFGGGWSLTDFEGF